VFRKDFETGRFPISKRSPVIGIVKEEIFTAYNHTELEKMSHIPGITMIGIWPGKKNTDVFILNTESYKDTPVAPHGHENIDSAESITVYYSSPNVFDHVTYTLPEQTPIICKDPQLVTYIKEACIKHIVTFDSLN
jgi:hypothetical protein